MVKYNNLNTVSIWSNRDIKYFEYFMHLRIKLCGPSTVNKHKIRELRMLRTYCTSYMIYFHDVFELYYNFKQDHVQLLTHNEATQYMSSSVCRFARRTFSGKQISKTCCEFLLQTLV